MKPPKPDFRNWHFSDWAHRLIATTVPIDRDHPFRAIATRLWTGVTDTVG